MVECKLTDNIVLVGRTNVGKSTLFNRITGGRTALVHNQPGVTRDCQEGTMTLGEVTFSLWDTAGFEDESTPLTADLQAQILYAVRQANVIIFLVDAREGLLPTDSLVAVWLRKHLAQGQTVQVVANKAENLTTPDITVFAAELLSLGFGEPLFLSAAHNIGLSSLYSRLQDILKPFPSEVSEITTSPLRITFFGRPNVGKSTLINAFLGETRVLTGPMAGLTRDTIQVPWSYQEGCPCLLIDTAGQRRTARVIENLEQLVALKARQALRQADLACLVIDATRPLEKQDLVLGHRALKEGLPLVLALNKWDQVTNPQKVQKDARATVLRGLSQDDGLPLIPISAQKQQNLATLFSTFLRLHLQAQRTFSTAELNQWLQETLLQRPPPSHKGKMTHLKYMTQTGQRPLSFLIFGTRVNAIAEAYQRYLQRCLKERFHLAGVPVKITFRQTRNPYGSASG
ncbi:MAG: ribosome biogenesis GTPase Der [Holosporales bacterium]|jgi:GTP-binding protein|nr:ribosome biogenesis GTPase Der [Holosporales bacterium]